jgi:hypothetical protein
VKERKVLENKETEGPSLSSAIVIERRGLDPWTLYLYAMKSPATKEKYLMRLVKFLDFLNIQEGGILEDKSRAFAEKGRDDSIWAFNSILKFIQLLKERVDRKEITAGTIRNYVKSIKLFCQMADIQPLINPIVNPADILPVNGIPKFVIANEAATT